MPPVRCSAWLRVGFVLGALMLPAAAATAAAPPGRPQVLPWIHDDYARALAEAKARKLPLFVESWAPW